MKGPGILSQRIADYRDFAGNTAEGDPMRYIFVRAQPNVVIELVADLNLEAEFTNIKTIRAQLRSLIAATHRGRSRSRQSGFRVRDIWLSWLAEFATDCLWGGVVAPVLH